MERKCEECGGEGAMPMRVDPGKGPASKVVDTCVACWRLGRGVPFGTPLKRQPARLRGLLDKVDVSMFPVGIRFESLTCKNGCCGSVVVSLLGRDRDMPEVWTTVSSQARVDLDIPEDMLYEKLLAGVESGLKHELREQFLVSNRRPFDPHVAAKTVDGDEPVELKLFP